MTVKKMVIIRMTIIVVIIMIIIIIIICFHKYNESMTILFVHCSNYFPSICFNISKTIIKIQSSTFVQTEHLDIT